jgi:hypothetical protein
VERISIYEYIILCVTYTHGDEHLLAIYAVSRGDLVIEQFSKCDPTYLGH